MNPLAERVRLERLARGWSVRDAARAGGLSNTWWARFEDGKQPLTDGIVTAVATAFGWSTDWAKVRPSASDGEIRVLQTRLDRMEGQLVTVSEQLVQLSEALGHLASLTDAAARLRVAKLSSPAVPNRKPNDRQ